MAELSRGRQTHVLWDTGRAGLQNAEQAYDHGDRAADEEAHMIARAHPLADEASGESVRPAIAPALPTAAGP